MEALQMLKSTLKKRRFNFTENLLTCEQVMDDREDDNDPLQWLVDMLESQTAGVGYKDIFPTSDEC